MASSLQICQASHKYISSKVGNRHPNPCTQSWNCQLNWELKLQKKLISIMPGFSYCNPLTAEDCWSCSRCGVKLFFYPVEILGNSQAFSFCNRKLLHRIILAGKDPQGTPSPALQWMTQAGIKPATLVLISTMLKTTEHVVKPLWLKLKVYLDVVYAKHVRHNSFRTDQDLGK